MRTVRGARRVVAIARSIGPEAGVGEFRFHGDVSQGLLLACANKNGDTVRYAERRQEKVKTRQLAKSHGRFLVAHRLRPSHRVSQKYFATLIRPAIWAGPSAISASSRNSR